MSKYCLDIDKITIKYCLDIDKPILWSAIDKETGEVKYEWRTNPVLDGFASDCEILPKDEVGEIN